MASIAVKENSLKVLNYLQEIGDANVTSADIAEALGLERKSVDGIVTAGLQRKGYACRVEAEIEVTNDEGNTVHKPVKFIKLTELGKNYNHEDALAADFEAATKASK